MALSLLSRLQQIQTSPTMRAALNSRLRFLIPRLAQLAEGAEDEDRENIGDVINQLNQLQERNHAVRVGIIGHVSSGKSTLINALLGANILPTGCGTVTPLPTYISHHQGSLFRAEFHFLSQVSVENDLIVWAESQIINDKKSDIFKAHRARVKIFFKGKLDIQQAYADLELQEFEDPELLIEGATGATDLDILHTARFMVDLVGAKPLVVECESPEDFAKIYDKILKCKRIASVLHHVDVSGPFPGIPPEVILVDTPGVGDGDILCAEQTFQVIPSLDEVWLVSPAKVALSLHVEKRCAQVAFDNNVDLRVIASFFDELITEVGDVVMAKDNVRRVIERNLMNYLNPPEDDWDEAGLGADERAAITMMVRAASERAEFTSIVRDHKQGVDPLVARIGEMGREEEVRVQNVATDLEELEQNAFMHNEPSLLPEFVATDMQQACIEALDLCGDIDIADTARAIERHCRSIWTTDGRTIPAVMSSNRKGVFLTSKNGQIDIMRDIADKWTSLMRTKQHTLLSSVHRALNAACDSPDVNPDLIETIRRKVQRMIRRFRDVSDQVMTSRVREAVSEYMQRHDFFSGRGRGRNFLPTSAELRDITDHLVCHLHQALDELRTQLTTSRLVTACTYDSLSPELRARLTDILNFRDELQPLTVDEEDFLCPISLDLMVDPVRVSPCGHTFDRVNIKRWMEASNISCCPLCRQRVQRDGNGVCLLLPNTLLMWRYNENVARHNAIVEVGGAVPLLPWWNVIWERIVNTPREIQE